MNTTNSQYLTNEEIRSLIEELKYERRFGYISNSYFRNVMVREQTTKPYLLIYGDFDDVGKSNDDYGFKRTDEFIKHTLSETITYLKTCYNKNDNEIECVSLGGDEFLFIIRDINNSEVSPNLLSNIHNRVFSKCKLSMSLGYSHSQDSSIESPSLLPILQTAQKRAEENKKEKNIRNYQNISLKDKFLSTLQTYLNALPIDGISQEEKSQIYNAILEKLEIKLKNPEKISKPLIDLTFASQAPIETKMLSTNWQNNPDELIEILNLLGTNPVTSGTRQSAFSKLIPYKKDEKFYYSFIDISKLKLSNLLFGHENTDEIIETLIQTIKTAFSKEGISIPPFDYYSSLNSSNHSNFIVNLHGCKLMLMISKNDPNANLEKINTILDIIQQECYNKILGITYVCASNAHKLKSENSFSRISYRLTRKCNRQKIINKKNNKLNSDLQEKWLQELINQLEIDYANLTSSPLDYEHFKQYFISELRSAFESIPVINTDFTYFDSIQTNPNAAFRQKYKVSSESSITLSDINFDKIPSIQKKHYSSSITSIENN